MLKDVCRERKELGGKSGIKGKVRLLTACMKGGHKGQGWNEKGDGEPVQDNLHPVGQLVGGGEASYIPGSQWEVSMI
jgi:hypothetical protein